MQEFQQPQPTKSTITSALQSKSSAARVTSDRRTKVQLQLEEEDSAPAQATKPSPNTPHIFLQDDDPEFADYDEEDPDDDLDI